VTTPHRTTTRGRSLPAVLLGVLAVLASLLAAPGTSVAAGASVVAAKPVAVRGAAPSGTGLRDGRDHLRAFSRRSSRDESAARAVAERRTGAGQGPAPFAAVLLTAVALTALAAGAVVSRGPAGHAPRRTPTARRGRAPPAAALA
jgi:hypothetical protein